MRSLFYAGLLSLLIAPCFSYADTMTANTTSKSEHHRVMVHKARSVEPVDINHANQMQLTTLKGVGAKRAAAILAYRQTNGAFQTVDDLQKVKGIGAKGLAVL